jgi:hypothetical protein
LPYFIAREKSCLHSFAYAALRFFARAVSGFEI